MRYNKYMNIKCLINATAIVKGKVIKGATLCMKDGKISYVGRGVKKSRCEMIDARGLYLAPGFIDCHIHGAPEDIFKNEVRRGMTSCVIAQSCAPQLQISKNLETIRKFKIENPLGENVLGVHLEGPFISLEKRGAQDKRYIRKPDAGELLKVIKYSGDLLKIMTIAPEVEGALRLIPVLQRKKIIASIGHTNATYIETMRAIDCGMTHATHIFNAMRRLDQNDAGASGAALFDKNISTEIIADLVHVKKDLLNIFLKIKSHAKIILITDSIKALNIPYIKNGVRQGSRLSMIDAIKNVVSMGVPLDKAVSFATENPAKLLGVYNRKGSISVGKDADLVLFDRNFKVKMVFVRGRIAYKNRL